MEFIRTNKQNSNTECIEILKRRKEKGLLSEIADKVTPIKPTTNNTEPENIEEILSSIFDD